MIDRIIIGKVLPLRKFKPKYGAPATGRALYCEQYSKNNIAYRYNLYFIPSLSYLRPKGWKGGDGLYLRYYKNLSATQMKKYYTKMLNDPMFKLKYPSLQAIQDNIQMEKVVNKL